MDPEAFDIGKAEVLGDCDDGQGGGAKHDLGAADLEVEDLLEGRSFENFAEASFEDPAGNAAVVCDVIDQETGTAEIGADELAGMVNGECCFFRVHEKVETRLVDYVKYVRQLS